MYLVKDREGVKNPWLTFTFGKYLWGSDVRRAKEFSTEAEALQVGREAMPTAEMKAQVVAVPA